MTLTTLVLLFAIGAPVPPDAAPAPSVAAPVAYKDLMLVIVTKDGAAAVVFSNQTKDGNNVEYSFRYESADGKKKLEGTGKLFERKIKGGDFNPDGLSIVAGPVSLTWSRGSADRGWVYYAPEAVTVHLAHAKNFKDGVEEFSDSAIVEELDLRRFMKK